MLFTLIHTGAMLAKNASLYQQNNMQIQNCRYKTDGKAP